MLRCLLVLLASFLVTVRAVVLTIPDASLVNGVVAGLPFTISWTDATGPVGLLLRNGVTNVTVAIIAFDLTGQTSYIWTPATSLPNNVYSIEIGDTNAPPTYSNLFTLTGGGLPTSTSSQIASTSSPSTFATSTSSNSPLPESTPTQQSVSRHHTHSGSFTRTYSGPPISRTPHPYSSCTSSSCTMSTHRPPPPRPMACTTSCMRNLNDTRVTHTANTGTAASTSTSSGAKSVTKSTQNAGLSPSAKVAIGVGAAVGSAIIIVLFVLTFWQGRRVGRASIDKGVDGRYMMHGAGGENGEKSIPPVELDASVSHNILEIDGRRREWAGRENG